MDSVSDHQVQEFTNILSSILSPDNDLRKRNEITLQILKNDHPNESVICILKVLKESQDQMIKMLGAVILRQMFSNVSPAKSQIWKRISEETKDLCKSELLNAMKRENILILCKRLGEVISELAVAIFTREDPGSWDQLVPFLFECVMGNNPKIIASGFHTLSELLMFFHEEMLDQKESLFQVFKRQMENTDLNVKQSCIQACCSMLGIVDTPDAMYFGELLSPIFKNIIWLIQKNEDSAEEVIKNLRDLAESEPKFFRPQLHLAFEFVDNVNRLEVENLGIKYLAIEFLVCLAERLNNEMINNKSLSEAISNKIVNFMMSIDANIEETWFLPVEGYQEQEDEEGSIDIDYAKLGRKMLSRLLEGVGDTQLMPYVWTLTQHSFSPSNTD